MNKSLYFVCPTDFLESVIDNHSLLDVNYYYTSLGNSVVFNTATLDYIFQFIEKENITKISFVLSDKNTIISDAIYQQAYHSLTGLRNFYDTISKDYLYKVTDKQAIASQIIQAFLKDKTLQLASELNKAFDQEITIEAKIYDSKEKSFVTIPTQNFLWRDIFSFN